MYGAVLLVWRAGRREFVISAVLQLVAGLGVTAGLLLGRRILTLLVDNGRSTDVQAIVRNLVPLALIGAVVAFANVARTAQQKVLSELVARYATNLVIDVAAAVDLATYERPSFHNRLVRAHVNAAIRPLQMATGVLGVVGAGFAVIGIGAALLILQPLFLVLIALAYVPAWIATTRVSKAGYDYNVEQTERDRQRDYLLAVLTRKDEAAEVRAFGLAGFLRERYEGLYDRRIADLRILVRRQLRLGLLGGLATSVLTGGAMIVLVLFVTSGRISLAVAGVAAGAVVLLGQRLQTLSSSAGALYESSLFIEDFTTFVAATPQVVASRATTIAPSGFGRLSVEHVSFTYPSRDQPSVRDVSLDIRAGEVVALVGENGSGKTTLAKLLAGLYEPQRGLICWDGVDVADYDPDTRRQAVAVIFQDFVKYQLTVSENIGMGHHRYFDDADRITTAARRAGAHDYIEALPDGYLTRLGAQFMGGNELSVGQWQRLALARLFFRDAPFVILDEPSAALDARAEWALFEDIRALFQGRTVVFISHRFSNVRLADRIFVLRHGQVIEHGSHDQLIAGGGLYAELYGLQASSYSDRPA